MSTKGNQEIDYADFGFGRESWGRPLTSHRRHELQRISREIAAGHNIADIHSHEDLVFRLRRIVTTYSPVEVDDQGLAIASDLPKFAEAKRKIEKALRALEDFGDAMHEVTRDPTMRAILDKADPEGILGEDFSSFWRLRMEEVLQVAVNLDGPRGRPPNPKWISEFLSSCREFWSMHQPGGSRPSSHLDRKGDLDSPVTEWAFALFIGLCEFEGAKPDEGKFQTEAKRLPKKKSKYLGIYWNTGNAKIQSPSYAPRHQFTCLRRQT